MDIKAVLALVIGGIVLQLAIFVFGGFSNNVQTSPNSQTATISSAYASTEAAGHPASNAIDNQLASYWESAAP